MKRQWFPSIPYETLEADIERRGPVWCALSNIYFYDYDEYDAKPTAQVVFDAGYSLLELEHMYRFEVAPASWINFIRLHGEEFEEFDREWFPVHVLRQYGQRFNKLRFILYPWIMRSRGTDKSFHLITDAYKEIEAEYDPNHVKTEAS
jgi:hypothetical protein